jgi:hypothetical protein
MSHRRQIRIGNVEVNCSPVTFRTPGQTRSVLSCPFTETLNVPITRTVNVVSPAVNGCCLITPTTETICVPVDVTVNLPPVQTPIPFLCCPPPTNVSPIVVTNCSCCP